MKPMKDVLYILLGWLLMLRSTADASCGSASCPLNVYHAIGIGDLDIRYVYEYINQNQVHVGTTRTFVGAIPQHHDEVQTVNISNTLQLQFGVMRGLSVDISLPFIHREHAHIHHHHGEDLWETWDFTALGDMRLGVQLTPPALSTGEGAGITLLAGVKLPTGERHVRNANGDEAEVAIQPGSGSTDAILGAQYVNNLFSAPMTNGEYSAIPLRLSATIQMAGQGTHNWRFGNSLVTSAGTMYQFARQAALLLQINLRYQGKADPGETDEPRENTGGTWILASPGLRILLNDTFSAYSYVQFPVYQNVNGIQQTAKVYLHFGLSANVNLLN
jgi:hypothetical protein